MLDMRHDRVLAKEPCQIGGITVAFYTSGQRAIPGECSSEFVWKPRADVSIPLTYTNWAPGEPNCWQGNAESCLNFRSDMNYQWNDVPCSTLCCPLCQADL